MSETQKILELLNEAASAATMLVPDDVSETNHLRATLEQIAQTIEQMGNCPADLIQQAKNTTGQASRLLEKLLQKDIEDTEKAIEQVSALICSLQQIVSKLASDQPPKEGTGTSDSQADKSVESTATDKGFLEEDIPLLRDFVTEAQEHIDNAEAALLELEKTPKDKEIINQIFRPFHTIKGMAGFLNLEQIGSLAHAAESLLDLARKDKLVMVGRNTDAILASIDMLKQMVADLAEAIEQNRPIQPQPQLDQLLQELQALAEQGPDESEAAAEISEAQDQKLDRILQSEHQLQQQTFSPEQSAGKVSVADEKIKVSLSRLDNLINMAGELAIAQLMVAEEINKSLAAEDHLLRRVTHLSKIVREIQELSMAMRMVPIGGVFQKMSRLVRDLSHKASKRVRLVTCGDETELDRNLVDKITDPLIHMVRNSVDHGIEPPDERVALGKDPTGRIELRAFHQAGSIIIEVEDDGRGLDKERILQKAVEKGLIDANQELTEQEIFKLIFHPGFSTAERVTDVSGRGVGMDVVKKNIESLRGKIELSSRPGKGTTFSIRLPLTLAIIDGQVVKVGTQRYIIPINSIVQSLRPTTEQISTVQNRAEMVMVRGELIPLLRLHKLFDVTPATENPTEALVVIVEEDNRRCCLLVDELLGQQQVVIKSLTGLGTVQGVSGGAIMGDGKVSLILDVPGLIELARK